MEMLEGLGNVIGEIGEDVGIFISAKPFASATIGAGLVGATALGVTSLVKRRRKTKKKTRTSKKRKTTRKRKGRKLKFGSPAYRKKYLGKGRKKRKLTPLMRRRKKIIARPGRQTPYTARGGKDRSTRRIRYTKNSQPYVILASGKARFIKKSSARSSRKRKGGRY